MKKLSVSIVTAFLLSAVLFSPVMASSESEPISTVSGKTAEAAQAEHLLARLDEINTMDKSTLTKPEKRQLRKEVRSINKSLRAVSGGVYVSAAAIIIVALLLILLL